MKALLTKHLSRKQHIAFTSIQTMSLSKWLKTGTVPTRSPSMAGLPDPAKALSTTEALLTQAANDAVEEMVTMMNKTYIYDDE